MMDEIITAVLSSAGLTGSLFAAIVTVVVKKVKKDADLKREERMKLEILRLEGEERLSSLLFALLRYTRGLENEAELLDAEKAYLDYLESCNKLKNEIIGNHTSN